VSLSLSEPAKEVMKLLQNAQLSWSNAGITVTGQKSTVGSGVVFNRQPLGPGELTCSKNKRWWWD